MRLPSFRLKSSARASEAGGSRGELSLSPRIKHKTNSVNHNHLPALNSIKAGQAKTHNEIKLLNSYPLRARARLREIDYNSYMQIQKMIKKGQILLLPPENINIDDSVNPSPKKNDEIEHRILKSNIKIHLMKQGSENVTYEYANLDVVDYDKNIVVECGKSYGNKILDVYDNVYQGIPKIDEFWIVDYYDESMISKLYKFKLIG